MRYHIENNKVEHCKRAKEICPHLIHFENREKAERYLRVEQRKQNSLDHDNKNLLILDIEWNDKKEDVWDIIELGALAVNNYNTDKETESTIDELFRPLQPLLPMTTKITGIESQMLIHKRPFRDYKAKLQHMINNADIVIFHGGKQDRLALSSNGVNLEGKVIVDTDKLARQTLRIKNTNLTNVTKILGLKELTDAHRAMADVRATYEVYKIIGAETV